MRTFDDLSRHLELKAKRLEAIRLMAHLILLSLVRTSHLSQSPRTIKAKKMKILDLHLRRLMLPNTREERVVVRKAKLA